MDQVPTPLAVILKKHDQDHVLAWWHEHSLAQRQDLVAQLQTINFDELHGLYQKRDSKVDLPPLDAIAPLPRSAEDSQNLIPLRRRGEEAFRQGEVAFLVVAGGQGSRLGFEHPKGMFPIGPVSGKTIFQIHAEKILALSRRFQRQFPFLVMTSTVTHDETVAYFKAEKFFGLSPDEVRFFQQGSMPALDLTTGRLLMEDKDRLFLGPNGHGGTLTGLADHGLLEWLGERGVRTLSYFQVDNPMVKLGDFVFLGRHLEAKAEVSSKVVAKQFPTEKLGNLCLIEGRCGIIEYSDLPETLAQATDSQGRPTFWAGSPAIHLFDVQFLERVTKDADTFPWHLARKKVPHCDEAGNRVNPTSENALKFERFIFDVLPRADRWTVTETTRAEEFEPVKNADGPESPATAKQAQSNLAGRWLESLGVQVVRDATGHVAVPLEISPLFALEPEDLKGRVEKITQIDIPMLLE